MSKLLIHVKRYAALILSCVLIVVFCGACGTQDVISSNSAIHSDASKLGSITIFTPADSTVTRDQHVNRWSNLTDQFLRLLYHSGFTNDQLTNISNTTLEEQSRAVQDYVVHQVSQHYIVPPHDSNQQQSSSSNSSSNTSSQPSSSRAETTLIIAPIVPASSSLNRYGDFLNRTISEETTPIEDAKNTAKNTAKNSQETRTDTDKQSEDQQNQDRLISSLQLAKRSGMHVIILANPIPNFTPDLYVPFANPYDIGRLQAQRVISKLNLSTTSDAYSQTIDILLPYVPEDKHTHAIAEEMFAGVLDVLHPYLEHHIITSPSGKLTTATTRAHWRDFAVETTNASAVKQRVDTMLVLGKSQLRNINAILTFDNDTAMQLVSKLDDVGYEGSSSEVNPNITLSGIIGKILGTNPISKHAPPEPRHSTEESESESESDSEPEKKATSPQHDDSSMTDSANDSTGKVTESNSWPLITTFGMYRKNLSNIVTGKEWMSVMINRTDIVTNLAIFCMKLHSHENISNLPFISYNQPGYQGIATFNFSTLISVSANNMKAALLDPRYISLADAGL